MRFSLIPALALLATLAVASPVVDLETRTDNNNNCHGGDTYCCNDSPALHNPTTGGFLTVPINVVLGLTCSPLTVLGIVLGTTWYVLFVLPRSLRVMHTDACVICSSKTTVCCQNVQQNGLINIGCIGLTL